LTFYKKYLSQQKWYLGQISSTYLHKIQWNLSTFASNNFDQNCVGISSLFSCQICNGNWHESMQELPSTFNFNSKTPLDSINHQFFKSKTVSSNQTTFWQKITSLVVASLTCLREWINIEHFLVQFISSMSKQLLFKNSKFKNSKKSNKTFAFYVLTSFLFAYKFLPWLTAVLLDICKQTLLKHYSFFIFWK